MSPEKRRPQRPGGIFEAMVPPCAGLAVTAVTPRGDTQEGGGAEHQHPGVGIHPWQEKGAIPANHRSRWDPAEAKNVPTNGLCHQGPRRNPVCFL